MASEMDGEPSMVPLSGPSAPVPRQTPLRLLPLWTKVQSGLIAPRMLQVPEMSAACVGSVRTSRSPSVRADIFKDALLKMSWPDQVRPHVAGL